MSLLTSTSALTCRMVVMSAVMVLAAGSAAVKCNDKKGNSVGTPSRAREVGEADRERERKVGNRL